MGASVQALDVYACRALARDGDPPDARWATPVLRARPGGFPERFAGTVGRTHPIVVFLAATVSGFAAALCLVLAAVETTRTRNVWIVPFIIAVVGGEEILTNTVKQLADRVRPALNPAAAMLGPSFPSGHAGTAAAFYGGAALLLGRQRPRPTHALLASLAAGIAVAVGGSRVLLDVHWLSDVIAGLALGWAWLAACSIAVGGRLLRFGATADAAARTAKAETPSGPLEVGLRQENTTETFEAPVRTTKHGDREVRDAKLGRPI